MSQLHIQSGSKSLSFPIIKEPKTANTNKLSPSDASLYRSCAMGLAHLAHDRPDLQFTTKELARGLQQPSEFDMEQLKRAVRYCKGVGRLVRRFEMQDMPNKTVTCTDSDFAGCFKTPVGVHGEHPDTVTEHDAGGRCLFVPAMPNSTAQ